MITYWGNPRPNGSGGTVFDAPVSIQARWQERREELHDGKGHLFVSKAQVFVDVDLDVGGYLYNGVSSMTDPTVLQGAYIIRDFVKTPNLGRTKHERRALL